MKGFVYSIVIFFSLQGLSQTNYAGSLEEAFSRASKEKKLVFIKYYSENCSHCQKLQEVLEIDSIKKFYNENFISYKIESENAPQDDYKFLKKQRIFIENVPCMLFFDADKKFIHYGQPKQEPTLVLKAGKTALDPVDRSSNLANRYAAGEKDVVTLKRYSKLAQLQKDTAIVNVLAHEIFNIFPKDQLLSINSIANVGNYVRSINNGFFVFWMNNYAKLDSVSPELKLADKEKIFKDILTDNINDYKQKWTMEDFRKARTYIEITRLSENPYSFFWEEESKLLNKSGKGADAFQIAEKMIELEKNKPHTVVYCINFYSELFSDVEVLKKLKIQMDQFFPLLTDNELKGKMYCYYLRVYKKLNDTKSFERTKYEAGKFLTQYQLDKTLFEELTK